MWEMKGGWGVGRKERKRGNEFLFCFEPSQPMKDGKHERKRLVGEEENEEKEEGK